ncbi:MAG: response regulator [Leptolyngbyaceae cyanobacterium bins.302]|nr:response regulator [Leptolyngbyaceae cyanobacterium bins.302]
MSFTIDPTVLESITQDARRCFLEEDAPGYLQTLEEGLRHLAATQEPDYQALMRAAHSIKGGAGIAQMPGLSQLAHHLEDLLEGFNQQKVTDLELGQIILKRGIEELAFLLSQASEGDGQADPDLLVALDQFLHHLTPPAEASPEATLPARTHLMHKTLEQDLENCLTHVEDYLKKKLKPGQLARELETLAESCNLLGEMFDLPWLLETATTLTTQTTPAQSDEALKNLAIATIAQIRQHRSAVLTSPAAPPPAPSSPSPPRKAAERPRTLRQLPPDEAALAAPQKAVVSDTNPSIPTHLRVSLAFLDEMGNVVGELITGHERLSLQQQQLKQAGQNLRRLVEQVKPIRDQVQAIYDQMSNAPQHREQGTGDLAAEFDTLEMDRYTALHTSLQTFEELITQIQETRVDIDLVGRELTQELTQTRSDLDQLYQHITRSRLVPFGTFAQRFIPQLNRLNQRCRKTSELHIQGEQVLIDRVLLEQLQTPLTHLLNNAVDHGIESWEDRIALEKPPTAAIGLEARVEGSEVVITFWDDGRGLDLKKIYRKAIDRGLCPASIPMHQLKREDILGFIFQSGFSTSQKVSDISGRGVGLDIVRTQVQQLRGNLEVDTLPGQGTTFTIRLPLSLSLLPLVLCQAHQQMLALPTDNVLDMIPYGDLHPLSKEGATWQWIEWRGETIPLLPLMSLLPYANLNAPPLPPRVALVLSGPDTPIAVTLDSILDERQFILHSFDDTLPTPPYIAGCTLLGTGEAVPVLLPRYFKPLLQKAQAVPPTPAIVRSVRTALVAEDSTAARRSLEQILLQAGFTVIACRDGQEALDEITQRREGIDLIISDVEMPRLNGFELLQKVRCHSFWYGLPVVMLTSRTGDRHRQKAMSLGASAYLGKPITPAELLSVLETLVTKE